jgi:hypothetical protein
VKKSYTRSLAFLKDKNIFALTHMEKNQINIDFLAVFCSSDLELSSNLLERERERERERENML